MNDIIKIANEIANSTNNATNFTNIQSNLPKTEYQIKDEVVEMIYQKHLQAQEWGNKLNQKSQNKSKNSWQLIKEKIDKLENKKRTKRGIPVDNVINYKTNIFDSSELIFSFSKELWSKIRNHYNESNNQYDIFSQEMIWLINDKVWLDSRIDELEKLKISRTIWNKFDELNSQISSSSKPYFRVTTSYTGNHYDFAELSVQDSREENGFIIGNIKDIFKQGGDFGAALIELTKPKTWEKIGDSLKDVFKNPVISFGK